MGLKAYAAALGAAVIAVTAFAVPSADAQQPRTKRVTVVTRDANGRVVRARTRVVVQPRSFLDAGTGVVPGERKFLDYAFPVGSGPGQGGPAAVTNFGNGRPGWDSWPSYNVNGPGWSGWP
jgi:hypothetical protein